MKITTAIATNTFLCFIIRFLFKVSLYRKQMKGEIVPNIEKELTERKKERFYLLFQTNYLYLPPLNNKKQ